MSLLKKAIDWGTRKSPWIIHFNAGSCNGCDIEIVDALTPRFDLERLGFSSGALHAMQICSYAPVQSPCRQRT